MALTPAPKPKTVQFVLFFRDITKYAAVITIAEAHRGSLQVTSQQKLLDGMRAEFSIPEHQKQDFKIALEAFKIEISDIL